MKFEKYAKKLKLNYFQDEKIEVKEKDILNLEKQIGTVLPKDYRLFLKQHGSARVGGNFEFAKFDLCEPSPVGDNGTISFFQGVFDESDSRDIRWYFFSNIIPPNCISIGTDTAGNHICLAFAGINRGRVYFMDHDQRCYWRQETLLEMFPNADPTIKEYFKLRDEGELEPSLAGYDHLYLIAKSFTEFLEKCEYIPQEEDEYDLIEKMIDNDSAETVMKYLKKNRKHLFWICSCVIRSDKRALLDLILDEYGYQSGMIRNAAASNNIEILKFFYESGFNTDPEETGEAFHSAIQTNSHDAIEFLLDNEVDIHYKDDVGRIGADLARMFSKDETQELLRKLIKDKEFLKKLESAV